MKKVHRWHAGRISVDWLAGLLLLCGSVQFADAKPPSDSDKEFVAKVAAKYFELVDPVEGWAWPPLVAIAETDELDAYSSIANIKPDEKPQGKGPKLAWIDVVFPEKGTEAGGEAAEKTDTEPAVKKRARSQPYLVVTQGYLDKLIKRREVILGQTIGHELSHIVLRHVESFDASDSSIVSLAFSREQEKQADLMGMKLSLKADFRYDELLDAMREKRKILTSYNSIVSLGVTHPGWTDRIESIDELKSQFWSSISAFENGVFFLLSENYLLAERCFTQVIKEMPDCYEAWANRGYCRLMMYCDRLDPDEIKGLGLNQVVVGGFYQVAASIETRGSNEELWFEAVGDLREALKLKDTLILPKANLALAYLVSPEGKQPGRAAELFEQVIAALKRGNLEEVIAQRDYAALLVNAGVTELANGDSQAANRFFDQVVSLYKTAAKPIPAGPVQSALLYSRASEMASSAVEKDRRDAVTVFEEYLRSTSPALTWWGLAFSRYKELCALEKIEPKSQRELAAVKNLQYRPVASLDVAEGKTIALNDSLNSVVEVLGEGNKSSLLRNSNIHRRKYQESGLELVCSERLIAIRMRNAKSPPLVLHASGPGGISQEVRVGMAISELEKLLDAEPAGWDNRYGTQQAIVYRYYPRLGFGVLVNDEDKISEIIIAQLPPQAMIK